MKKVLHIEDDLLTALGVAERLKDAGYDVEHCDDVGEETLTHVRKAEHDIILLDIYFSGQPKGLEVLEFITRESIPTPIIVLSGSYDIADKVAALKAGADDYITKPFHGDELCARIEALLRRYEKPYEKILRLGNLHLHLIARQLFVCEIEVHLSPMRFVMLKTLVEAQGEPVSRTKLEKEMFGSRERSTSFSVHMSQLKSIVHASGWDGCIQSLGRSKYAASSKVITTNAVP